MATGVAQPLMMLISGDMLDALSRDPASSSSVADAARPLAYKFLVLGACTFCCSYIATYCFTCAGELDM
jgi:hypothetical protein